MLPVVPKLLTHVVSYLPHYKFYILFTKNMMKTTCTFLIQLVPMGLRLLNICPPLTGCHVEKGLRKHL